MVRAFRTASERPCKGLFEGVHPSTAVAGTKVHDSFHGQRPKWARCLPGRVLGLALKAPVTGLPSREGFGVPGVDRLLAGPRWPRPPSRARAVQVSGLVKITNKHCVFILRGFVLVQNSMKHCLGARQFWHISGFIAVGSAYLFIRPLC